MTLEEFSEQLKEEVLAAREVDGREDFAENAFVARFLEYLADAGEIDDAEAIRCKQHGLRVNGYGLDIETETLDLFVAVYHGESPPAKVDKTSVETAFRQLIGFFQKARGDLFAKLEEAGKAFDAAFAIHAAFKGEGCISRVRLFLLTDGVVRSRQADALLKHSGGKAGALAKLEVSYHIWDVERLYRWYTSGRAREEIDVNVIETQGQPLPCLRMPSNTAADYETFLVFVPGTFLVEVYGRYGARLLERNVRSFLQAKGAVNSGIRKTILEEPQRFLAYNNGLTATAAAIDVVPLADGGIGLSRIRDLQIVNGGQTTASLFHASRKDSAAVGTVTVQLKLNRVKDAAKLDEVVAKISQYANSQNKVNVADFSANDPFHRRLEELSRTVWAPPVTGSQRQTHWFYERARGQYADDRARSGTKAKAKEFELLNPRSQMFTKTDLAKYENTWMQLPHRVSRGAQKNFSAFVIELQKRGSFTVDEKFFHRVVAKAILFKSTERLVQAENYGGYRANIVTYTLALISHATGRGLDLEDIWKAQAIADPLQKFIRAVADDVQQILLNPPAHRRNISEWCKDEACWDSVKALKVKVPARIALTAGNKSDVSADLDADHPIGEDEAALIAKATAVSSSVWYALAKWAKSTSSLAPWQRSLAFSMGKICEQKQTPSVKQARQGLIALAAGQDLGFARE
jgi:AIPR protein